MTVATLPRNTSRNPADRRSLLLAASVCLLSFATFWAAQRAAGVSMIDLMVYRAEGRTVLDGRDLYAMRATSAQLPATYPPFAALLFTPLTLPDIPGLRTLATAGNLLLLVVFARLSLRLTLPPGRLPRPGVTALWVAAAAVWCEPVWTTLRYGQINLLLAVAVMWDLTRRDGHRWAGVGTGLAAAVKLTPALFAVLFLVVGLVRAGKGGRNPWLRRASTAALAFCAATLAAAAVLPRDSLRFWSVTLFETHRAGSAENTANQSLRGVLARLLHTGEPAPWWTATAAAVAALGLTVAVAAALRGERAAAMAVCAATALLVSPVSWSHHWVWCVPIALFLGTRAGARWALAAALVFCSYALWWVPHGTGRPELSQGAAEMALSALYPLTAAALIGYVAVSLVRPWRTSRTA
ncbi:glycosyltransferase 87 family protein [Streptomyces sp. NPDC056730]|uniref:glycosyltransferase 87 family protein n=1 Tax=unclassified Streptomyces TaxID=2593676 RepID=UPI0036C9C820